MNSLFNVDADLLFPLRVLPALKDLRGQTWKAFMFFLLRPQAEYAEQLAFALMMARMGGCAGCDSDSYRAMRGCTACARQTVKRYKGTDEELIAFYNQTLTETLNYLISQ
jgi:hypothetical protein